MSDRDNFERWYGGVLERLYGTRDAGITIFMVSLPLLERYLRQKSGIGARRNLTEAFHDELVKLFPVLGDTGTSRQFWTAYRHGWLHQVSLSISAADVVLPECNLTHDIAAAIERRRDGAFALHPVRFCEAVLEAIRADFDTFAATVAGAPPLPVEKQLDPVGIPSLYLGTGTP